MEVRYLGLDTPETHHPEKPVEYFGFKTSEFNKQLVEAIYHSLDTLELFL
ncbi:thermonuclease family protein [Candidatus Bipolaricaulota bacterium]|nr:thermonuclease family protein [Candidatus Bipolaricaulota bacterium]